MRVLICDDSKKDAEHIKNIIKHYNPKIKIDIANTIDAMNSLLLDSKYIAIFLDLSFTESETNKPIFDGLQAIPGILTIQPNLPLIFVSGYLDYDMLRKILQIESNTVIDAFSKDEEPSAYTHALEKAIKIENKKISQGKKLFDASLKLYQDGKYSEAFTSLANAIDSGYNDEKTLNLFSKIVNNIANDERNAIPFFYNKIDEMKEILKRTPSKEIKLALAIAYENIGDLKKATKFLEEVRKEKSLSNDLIIKVDKKLKKLYNELGEIREEKQLRDEILEIYQKKENITESIDLLKEEILQFPSDPNLLLKLIILEKKQEQWADIANYTKKFLERLVDKIFDPEFGIDIFKRLIEHIDLTHKKLNSIYTNYDFYKKIIKFCIDSEQIDLAYNLSLKHFDELFKNDIDLLKNIVEYLELENFQNEEEKLINKFFEFGDDSFYLNWIKILYQSEKYSEISKEYKHLIDQIETEFSRSNDEAVDKFYDKFIKLIPYFAESLEKNPFYENVSLAQEIMPFLLKNNRQKAYDLIYKFLIQSFIENNYYNIQIFMDIFRNFSDFWTEAQKTKLENAYYTNLRKIPENKMPQKTQKISRKSWKEKIRHSDHHKKKSVINFQMKCASSIYVDEVAIRNFSNGTLRQFHKENVFDDKSKNIELEYYFYDGQYMHRVILQTTTRDEKFVKKIRKEIHEKTNILDKDLENEK